MGQIINQCTINKDNSSDISISDIELSDKIICKGSQAIVHYGFYQERIYAIKISNCKQEFTILRQLAHKNISQLIGYTQKDSQFYLYFQYIPLSLQQQIQQFAPLDFDNIQSYITQLIQVLLYLYQKNICHNDIKPLNILITEDNQLKLIDFGSSYYYNNYQNQLGTLEYMCPECIKYNHDCKKRDIYSFGVIFYEVVYGIHPFAKHEIIDIIKLDNPYELIEFTSPSTMKYQEEQHIVQMLKKIFVNENERISIKIMYKQFKQLKKSSQNIEYSGKTSEKLHQLINSSQSYIESDI